MTHPCSDRDERTLNAFCAPVAGASDGTLLACLHNAQDGAQRVAVLFVNATALAWRNGDGTVHYAADCPDPDAAAVLDRLRGRCDADGLALRESTQDRVSRAACRIGV